MTLAATLGAPPEGAAPLGAARLSDAPLGLAPLLAAGLAALPEASLAQFALDLATKDEQTCLVAAFLAALPREGTTTVLANLALLLEQRLRRRVMVVDANMAAPLLHTVHGVALAPGLAEVLRGEVPLREAVQTATSRPFAILPAGHATPSEQAVLLASARLPGLLDQLRREAFDLCLIDCPAAQVAPETAMLARHADAIYCVIRAERTQRQIVAKTVERLRGTGCTLGGVILNRAPNHIPGLIDRFL